MKSKPFKWNRIKQPSPFSSSSKKSDGKQYQYQSMVIKSQQQSQNLSWKTEKYFEAPLIKEDITRFYKIPSGPFKTPEDVVKSFGYELIKELDRGAFGIVFIAKDKRKQIDVACKQLEIDPEQKETIEENKNELLVLEKVRHPYVIRLYCHFVVQNDDGLFRMYIFMALADGGNLYKSLKKRQKPIDEQLCKLYFAQIICGINHMHKIGIAHRDIKLQNILLCSNPKSISGDYLLVVTDFGLSKRISNSKKTKSKDFCGTPLFMSPQILKHEPYDLFAADIWALGITLFMILSLDTPFDFNKPDDLVLKQMLEKNLSFDKLKLKPSNEFKDLCKKLLDPNEKTRIKMSEIIKHSFISNEFLLARNLAEQMKKDEWLTVSEQQ